MNDDAVSSMPLRKVIKVRPPQLSIYRGLLHRGSSVSSLSSAVKTSLTSSINSMGFTSLHYSYSSRHLHADDGHGVQRAYSFYQFIGAILGGVLFISLVVMHIISKKIMYLHYTFRSIHMKKGRLYFLDTNLSLASTERAKRVQQSCQGLLRIAVAFVYLHVWQKLVILIVSFGIRDDVGAVRLANYCESGWDCYGFNYGKYGFMLNYVQDSKELCFEGLPRELAADFESTTCCAVANADALEVGTAVAVSWALINVFAGAFELSVWLLYLRLGQIGFWVAFAVTILSYMGWATASFLWQIPPFRVVNWLQCIQALAVPLFLSVVLYTTRQMKQIRLERRKRWLELVNRDESFDEGISLDEDAHQSQGREDSPGNLGLGVGVGDLRDEKNTDINDESSRGHDTASQSKTADSTIDTNARAGERTRQRNPPSRPKQIVTQDMRGT